MKDFTHPLKELWMEPRPSRLSVFGKFLRSNWKRLCIIFVIIAGTCGVKFYPRKPEPIPWEPARRSARQHTDEDTIQLVSDSGGISITTDGTASDAIQITAGGYDEIIIISTDGDIDMSTEGCEIDEVKE